MGASMRIIRAALFASACLAISVIAPEARAQGCGTQNPNCVVPTAPLGTSTNQAASTKFVQQALAGSMPLPQAKIYIGSLAGIAVAQTLSGAGDCTVSLAVNGVATIVCTKTNGVSFAPSATTDATNASNIASGTLANARYAAVNLAAGNVNGGVAGTLPFTNLPTLPADNIAANPTAGTAIMQALALVNCSTALTYSTSTHTFGCNGSSGVSLPFIGTAPSGDMAATIQAGVTAGGSYVIPCGATWNVGSTITVGAQGLDLAGQAAGCATIHLTANVPLFSCSSQSAQVVLKDLIITGTAANFNGTINITDSGQQALAISDCPNVLVQNVVATNLSGAAFDCQAPSSSFATTAAPRFNNVSVFNSYVGFYPRNSCEYANFSSVIARNNIFGMRVLAGNIVVGNFQFVYNITNIQVVGQTNPNPCHGVFSNGAANHGVSYNLDVLSCGVGQDFVGVHFLADGGGSLTTGGLIRIANSKGVNITGGEMGSNIQIVQADPNTGLTTSAGQNRLGQAYIRNDITGFTNPSIGYAGGLTIVDTFDPSGFWSQNTSGTITSGALALATSAITSGACTSAQTATATGIATTDTIVATFSGDPTATTGYIPATSGMLTIIGYPTANAVNFKVCNNTAASITPGAVTVNWRVVR